MKSLTSTRTVLVAFLTASTLASVALADPLDDATAAYNRGDYAAAVLLLRPLADAGNAAAQHNLGMMYIEGKGVPQSSAEGVDWYRKAGEGGDADAQRELGSIYEAGTAAPQNKVEAATWYRRAAEQGDGIAQFKLAVMYAEGQGVRRSYVQAYKWFALAETHLPESDSSNREKAIRNRDALTRGMTAEQVSEAQKLAREWTPSVQRRPDRAPPQ